MRIDALREAVAKDGAGVVEEIDQHVRDALEAFFVRHGDDGLLEFLLDVTNAQRVLSQARSTDITARTQVLTTLAELAFRTGDLLRTVATPGKP